MRRVLRVEEELVNLGRLVKSIAHMYGLITEEGFREAVRFVIEEVLGVAKVSKWVYYDAKGVVYQRPSNVEVDVVIKDGEHILVEVKSRVDKGDLVELYNIGKLYSEVSGVKPKLLILSAFFARGVLDLARELGVELVPIVREY
ncbi:MAG: DUF3782 domain-containing protein [Sulfolobales archaeon]|nr:DUF3782 domain-containing protein [Sulfolobales archaeon]MCX8186215.1 DUF3782 domain-containing protein [Sulfolobales archaeon]MDW7970180.1 DUF3782 domain-containing protein [Sulfolobales archaeon]